ncbi:MAG: HNH endonuclease [Oscillospiraceae bacterium]|nr:HNH endonuclease [Oscillospiraceae bacterium]
MDEITIKVNHRNIDKNTLLLDLKNIANKINSNTLSTKQYKESGGEFGVNTFLRRFGSWNNALQEAKLDVNTNNNKYSEVELYKNYISICEKLGKQASYNDMRVEKSAISRSTYDNHFGSWNKFLTKFIDYLNDGKLSVESEAKDNDSDRKNSRSISLSLRYKILVRDKFSCKKCGQSPAKNPNVVLHVDHIVPFSKGGDSTENNLEIKCSDCNYGKSNNYDI